MQSCCTIHPWSVKSVFKTHLEQVERTRDVDLIILNGLFSRLPDGLERCQVNHRPDPNCFMLRVLGENSVDLYGVAQVALLKDGL